jgi:hypothetical protein
MKNCGPSMEETKMQFAVLPWRRTDGLEIMLVSSRETGRWVLPKGWPMKGLIRLPLGRPCNSWLEKDERTRKWFAGADAAGAVEESELRELILKFGMFAAAGPKNAKQKHDIVA